MMVQIHPGVPNKERKVNTYFIVTAANIHMDQILKDVNTAYNNIGGTFWPVFNIDGTKVLFQIKPHFTVPPNAIQASSFTGAKEALNFVLSAVDWQSRIYPPDSLVASYFSGTLTLGQFLTQIQALTPEPIVKRTGSVAVLLK